MQSIERIRWHVELLADLFERLQNELDQLELANSETNGDEQNQSAGRKRKSVKRRESYTDDFLEFWFVYPPGRKQAKRKAFEAWKRAIIRADAGEIKLAAAQYAQSPAGQSDYVKSPEAWLNGNCWEDDPQAWQRSGDRPKTFESAKLENTRGAAADFLSDAPAE